MPFCFEVANACIQRVQHLLLYSDYCRWGMAGWLVP